MTRTKDLAQMWDSLSRVGIGLDHLLETTINTPNTNYPPHNIIRENENQFRIELAAAGFDENEIQITLEGRDLTVTGRKVTDLDKDVKYIHRGLAFRNFTKPFKLGDHVEVVNAEMKNGLLMITLKREIPEALQPKQIPITGQRQLLTEDTEDEKGT